jgi:hypothetical protein
MTAPKARGLGQKRAGTLHLRDPSSVSLIQKTKSTAKAGK